MKGTIRINFEFPKDEYPYLKMICAEEGISLKEFATKLLLKGIEEYEDRKLSRKARARLKKMKEEDNIPLKKACDLAEWDHEKT